VRDPVTAAAGELARGRLLVLFDEGEPYQPVVIQAAERVEDATVNFMVRFARGVVSVAVPPERRAALSLQLIPATGRRADRRRIAVSVESARGVTTGISAADRARTIRVLADPASVPADLRAPGHVMPIVAHPRGSDRPYGLPEAAVDLGRRAGLGGVVAVCTILDERGDVAGRDAVREFCERHGLRTVSVAAIRPVAATAAPSVRNVRWIERSHGPIRGVR
jgi:3,4-dihydroxy 2-butanone 4-phosphate synthase / GTP cyclohydrolase II